MNNCFVALGVKPISGRHTAEKMSELMSSVFREYQIDKSKLYLILRDGEADMDAMTRFLEIDAQWCFAHIINLVSKVIVSLSIQ